MGAGRWSSSDWSSYKSTTTKKATTEIFRSYSLKSNLDPKGVKVRESRDSVVNPMSNAIIVGVDVTGSMGILADKLAREGLGTLFQEILDRKPVSDPHVMFMAIGDANCDSAPLQVSQFEADTRIIPQLTDIYLEGGGGGNRFESYNLPWYFAATHTSIDCFEKRGKKGYLFTVGDEMAPGDLTVDQIRRVVGDELHQKLSNEQLLTMVTRMYEVFHVVVEEGSFARSAKKEVYDSWKSVLGQRVIPLTDYTKLSEVIVSAIQVCEGSSVDTVAKSWSGDTSLVVSNAVAGLAKIKTREAAVVRL